jgi:hypothetical protein
MSGESFPNPDPAEMDRFLAAADDFLAATAAQEETLSEMVEKSDTRRVDVTSNIISAMRRHGVAHLPPEVDGLSDEDEPEEHTEEQERAVRKAGWLGAAIVHLEHFEATTDPGEIRDIIGKALVGIEDPEQTKAWLRVLKDTFQSYVNLDEILGPEPEATVLQLVAAEEQAEGNQNMYNMRKRVAALLVEKIFKEFGEHDDLVDLKYHTLFLCALNDDEPLYETRIWLELKGLINIAREFRPDDHGFPSRLRETINGIRASLFDLPPIEGYLLPGWEALLNDEEDE